MPEATEPPRAHHGVVAVLDGAESARRAAEALLAAGVAPERVGLIGRDEGAIRAGLETLGFTVTVGRSGPDELARHLEPPGRDELAGAAMGGVAGLAVGLGPFLIPGIGPLLFAYGGLAILGDALLASALGAGFGAGLGALFEQSVEVRHRLRWRHALEAGGWLVVVWGDRGDVERACAVFARVPARHTDVLTA